MVKNLSSPSGSLDQHNPETFSSFKFCPHREVFLSGTELQPSKLHLVYLDLR